MIKRIFGFLIGNKYRLRQFNGIKRFIPVILFATIWLQSSCSQLSIEQTEHKRDESQPYRVLLLNSNQEVEKYQIAEQAYSETIYKTKLTSIDLGKSEAPVEDLLDELNHQQYDAIYCIGAKALGSIDYIDPDLPVIYSSVLNWRRFGTQGNYFGVAEELAPQAQLTWFTYFFPSLKNIGVLYSEHNATLVEEAIHATDKLSVSLTTKKIKTANNLEQSARSLLTEVDALWLISDPEVLSSTKSATRLFELADRYQTPVLAYNHFFTEFGATLTITADLATTGRQAALLTHRVLESDKENNLVQYPAGSQISINLKRVQKFELKLNQDALESVSELITE